MQRFLVLVLPLLTLGGPALAQQSASYKLQESVLNAGGHPAQGTVLSSASFKIKLDSIGEGLAGIALGSASYHADGGFVGAYPPPGEVTGDYFRTKTMLAWNPEKSVGVYNVYRNTIATLPGAFGTCLGGSVPDASYTDATVPSAGTGYFYLVTAENRLGEEGTKGYQSSGVQRTNTAACP